MKGCPSLFVAVAVALLFAGNVPANGQAGRLDPTFRPLVRGRVFSTAIQTDQKILVAGLFTNVNDQYSAGLVRLHQDGSTDGMFQVRPGDYPKVVGVDRQGKILIKGSFSTVNGIRRYRIARLNTDGSLDETFDTDFRLNSYANFAFQSDGRILVDGPQCLHRLNYDGSIDPSFSVVLDQWSYIESIATLPDDRIVIIGNFFYVNGIQCTTVATLLPDGGVDFSFNTAALPFYNKMTGFVRLEDGRVVVGGSDFTRLLASGRLDPTFPFYDDTVVNELAMTAQNDGKILATGVFYERDGVNYRTNLTRYLPNGSTDFTFNPGASIAGGLITISTMKLQQDQRILIGGGFTQYDNVGQSNLVRVLNDWPVLESKPGGEAVQLSWPAAYTNFVLQSASSITAGAWADDSAHLIVTNDICYVTNTISESKQFFRLVRKP
jgi:uncharacterized delta-60 repeat protein